MYSYPWGQTFGVLGQIKEETAPDVSLSVRHIKIRQRHRISHEPLRLRGRSRFERTQIFSVSTKRAFITPNCHQAFVQSLLWNGSLRVWTVDSQPSVQNLSAPRLNYQFSRRVSSWFSPSSEKIPMLIAISYL